MSSREDILQNIRRNTRVRYEKPDLSTLEKEAITYADPVAQFCKTVGEVGGHVIEVRPGQDVNVLIHELYPDAKRIASNLKEITCATFHPDDVASSAELDGTDLAVVRGRVGVCENGAVWIEQDVEQRAVYFISEALILLLDRKNLVNNMHEAYQEIDTGEYGYGVFISGPSKTADIEQALVLGAHGARELTVLLF
ncbi:LUD domain-containing protein [uncultured Bacteroides sp.]|uniref:LutC/YkgG family protein n=1 Tax=uncultured Bacteroides sp. TaxID=162156 RepID=UPI00280A522E|nr:LUD domain-containing protein [uncultured Bacteroides sp.]